MQKRPEAKIFRNFISISFVFSKHQQKRGMNVLIGLILVIKVQLGFPKPTLVTSMSTEKRAKIEMKTKNNVILEVNHQVYLNKQDKTNQIFDKQNKSVNHNYAGKIFNFNHKRGVVKELVNRLHIFTRELQRKHLLRRNQKKHQRASGEETSKQEHNCPAGFICHGIIPIMSSNCPEGFTCLEVIDR
ncbi:uncharacterized protein LOC130630357 [Hydractinia symbiolongicarpus]|uniref:uncharacterized protein LOC130630357 n=1 Tax=Hydractinia symbiolongicarpus TaxID=13093 RepID=UPI00254BE58C|nr:uncharacterized protein LOC130630357 [Hydractinia symbiolongicarpus]